MKKWIFSAVLLATMGASATAQTTTSTLTPDHPLSSGELFQGMSKAIPNGRIVLPYGLEVTFEKTVHLIFPAPVRYVDLGSQNIIAGKAEDAESTLLVLGYGRAEIAAALRGIDMQALSLEDIIKAALKKLM